MNFIKKFLQPRGDLDFGKLRVLTTVYVGCVRTTVYVGCVRITVYGLQCTDYSVRRMCTDYSVRTTVYVGRIRYK